MCVCVDLVWVADNVWESASVCVCVYLVWVSDNVWESASVCVRVWIWSGLQITYGRVQVSVCTPPLTPTDPPRGEFYVLPYRKSEQCDCCYGRITIAPHLYPSPRSACRHANCLHRGLQHPSCHCLGPQIARRQTACSTAGPAASEDECNVTACSFIYIYRERETE